MIRLARNLSLPIEAQTQTFAILAIRGVGKTYTCLKMAEGFHAQGLQFVFVDPTGVAWGLRSSADGKKPGLPVMIFGGERGDVPLEESSGKVVADFVVDEGVSCVLDLSDLRKGAMTRFMCEFAERLYHNKRRRRDALHIFLDEADAFAPQRPRPNQAQMLGAVEDLIRKGRSRGLGLTLATQRSAVLNKDVLTQCETLFAMCVVAPHDRKAVDEWLKHAGDEKKRGEINAALASLDLGEAFVWSPRWLKTLKRIKVLKRTTFDSSSTPKAGKKAKQPKTRADVDLDKIRKQMAGTVERAEANDPRKLRAENTKLRRELVEARADAMVEEAVVDEEAVRELVSGAINARDKQWSDMLDALPAPDLGPVEIGPLKLVGTKTGRIKCREPNRANSPKKAREVPSRENTPLSSRLADLSNGISPARGRILDALAFLHSVGIEHANRTQLALFADMSPKSSGYANNLGALRTGGLIDYPQGGKVTLTDMGKANSNLARMTVSNTEEMHAALERKLPAAKWKLVQVLIDSYPTALDRETLADKAGVSSGSSGYANNLGALRSLGVIDYPQRGLVVATEVLFLEP